MSYDAGSAFLQIVPSFKGVVDQIDSQAKEWGDSAGKIFADTFNSRVSGGTSGVQLGPGDSSSTQQGDRAAGKFADGFRARIEAALKDLPDVKIDGDSSDADRKIDEIRTRLETLRDARVGVDISDTDALAAVEILKGELDELGSKSPNIRVRVDAGAAAAELAAIDAEAPGAGGGLATLGADADGAIGGISALVPAIAALIAALVPLAGLAGGALATLPALFAGAGAGGAALGIGLSGISGAISAYGKKPTTAGGGSGGGTSAATQAQQQREAANTVISAQEAVANAQETAANSVHSAQEQLQASTQSLAAAERDEANAQQAVIDARTAAQRQLDDYTNQLADSALSIQQAQLDIETAETNLTTTNATPGATDQQKAQAQLDYEQSVQNLKDLQTQNQQLQQDASTAAAAGVEGNGQVVAAEQQLSDAQQGVATATQSQSDAQTALSQAQAKGVQSVQDAQRAYTLALENQQTTISNVGSASAGAAASTDSFAAAMAGLTPAGRAFVNYYTGTVLPMYNLFKTEVQATLLPGLTTALQLLTPFIQAVAPFILQAAFGIGLFATALASFLSSSAGIADTNAIFSAGAGFMEDMAGAALDLVKAFGTVGSEATPIVGALGSGIDHLVQAFGKWVSGGGFEKFLGWLKDNGPTIVSDVSRLVTGIGHLLTGLAPFGIVMLNLVSYFAAFLGWLGRTPAALSAVGIGLGTLGAIAAGVLIALDVTNPIGLVITAIGLLILGITELATHWSQVWTEVKQVFASAVNFLRSGFGTLVVLILGPFAPIALLALHWQQLWSGMQTAAGAVWGWLDNNIVQPIETFFNTDLPAALHFLEGVWDTVWSGLQTAVEAVWKVIKPIFDAVKTGLSDLTKGANIKPGDANSSPGSNPSPYYVPPGRATGGSVLAGHEYTVGEHGWETFVPNVSGTIIPHGGLSSAQLAAIAVSPGAGGGSSRPVHIEQTIVAYDPSAAATKAFQIANFAAKTRGR